MDAKKTDPANWRSATKLVRGGTERSPFQETSEGLFLTSGYVYDSAEEAERAFTGDVQRYMYSRYANPTVTMFENRLALLEGAEYCVSTATGMAAAYAALTSQLKAGDRVVASRALFGSCHYIITQELPKFGIETVLVDGIDLDAWAEALEEKTQCVFLETPSNPALEIIDIKAVSELAHKAGALLIIDNVFATPILQKPLELGADIVMYSATKHIDGQGRTLGGAILTNNEDYFENLLKPFLRHTGPSLSPFNAWVLLKGLETLDLRVRRHVENAHVLAKFLEGRKQVTKVLYPGLGSHPQHELAMRQMTGGGTMVSFEVDGGKDGAFRFLDGLGLIDISNNLGDAKSLITHPATTTHHRLSPEERMEIGISDGLVRLSVGLEDVEDLKEDLDQAL
ncbi:MAG: O-succinylhomoserine sulfhydrylase [Proteobacteria bacterium]|nr:O-succinylhomoserine sulfhydrylase [Pseudomonadota bacterium]MDA1022500.1 O-succinylhomoserine sulfhydrylase [Pseudomonadota bacterium]